MSNDADLVARLELALLATRKAAQRLQKLTRTQRDVTKELRKAALELRAHQPEEP